jgi:hypothetical protein
VRWPAALILFLVCLGGVLGMGWHWMANRLPEDSLTMDAPVGGSAKQKVDAGQAGISSSDERSLETQIHWIRGRAAAMEADLTQPAAPGFGDPADELLADTRRRLDSLERDLTTKKP